MLDSTLDNRHLPPQSLGSSGKVFSSCYFRRAVMWHQSKCGSTFSGSSHLKISPPQRFGDQRSARAVVLFLSNFSLKKKDIAVVVVVVSFVFLLFPAWSGSMEILSSENRSFGIYHRDNEQRTQMMKQQRTEIHFSKCAPPFSYR